MTTPSSSSPAGPYDALEALGLKWERTTPALSEGTHTVRMVWTLPNPSEVGATFSREQLKHKVLKLFKRELQVGEARFDDAVFITTDTPEATAAFLEAPAVREAVLSMVIANGTIQIDGDRVTLESSGATPAAAEPDAPSVGLLLVHLLGLRQDH